ncbi:hypothetical protein DER45DRAFT_517705 [Fusarium avenaceum]|nr:hypothetical protein DER45DRAFT_517705 [Fusarium avenaceum]
MAPKPKSFLRRLGYIELYQSGMHDVNHYCSTITTCRYTLPPSLVGCDKHAEVAKAFDRAVAQTVIQFPMLQVGLVGEGTRKPAWVSLASVDLAAHIIWDVRADSTNYDEVFEANLGYQLDAKFERLETQPGWRLLLMRPQTGDFVDAMFVWNHTNTDGVGSKIFHQTLLKHLSEPSTTTPLIGTSRVITTAVSKERFPQPQEKLAKHRVTVGFAFSEIWHNFGPSAFLSSTAKARWAPIRATPYITRSKCINIGPVILKRLLSLCREHETTLTGLLHGVVLACLSVDISEGAADAFNVITAMDQRRFILEEDRPSKFAELNPENSIQNCVASIYHTFGREIVSDIRAQARINNWAPQPIHSLEPEIWKAAKTIRNDVQERLDLGLTNSVVGLMKLVTDWQEYHRDTLKKPRELSWIVTNIGVMDSQPKNGGSSWSLQKARFSLCADVAGPAMQIGVASVKGGGLDIDLTWQDLDELNDVGIRLAQDMESWLLHLGA